MSDIAADIAALLRDRPRGGEDDQTRADWYDRKARVFAAVAEQRGPDADDARDAADQAWRYAARIRAGGDR